MNKILKKLNIEKKKLEKYADDYKKHKTDQERLIFTFNIMLENNIIPKATGIQKNVEDSEKLCKEGDTLFSQVPLDNTMCIDALELYTMSIAFAPYSSEQLAIAYANRSAVLFRLGLHLECIQDIDRALVLNYPDHLKTEIDIRRAECLITLGKSSVENDIKETQHRLERMSLNDKNRKKILDVLFDKINIVAQEEPEETESDILPTIIESYNNEIPCASDAITVKYNERYGRHIVATRDIRPGELLAVEKPYSLMILPGRRYTHCSNCLKLCWSNIPCNYCVYAIYCSEECKDVAWRKYHDVECAVLPALIEYDFKTPNLFSLKLAILAVREAGSISKLKTMLEDIDKSDVMDNKFLVPRTKGFSQDGKLHSDKYISIYSLLTHTENRNVEELLVESLGSCVMLYLFGTQTMFFGTKLPEDIDDLMKNNDATFFGGLTLRHVQTISCNIHNFEEMYDLVVIYRGLAAMPFHSLINHSCDPNVFRGSRSEDMMLYATHPIRKGAQIFDNYEQRYTTTTKKLRQKYLFKYFFFFCDCLPCLANWPCYTELVSFNHLITERTHKLKIRKALKKLDMYFELAKKDEVLNKPCVVKNLLNMIQVLHDNVPMPCQEINIAVGTLKEIWNLTINRFKTPKLWPYEE